MCSTEQIKVSTVESGREGGRKKESRWELCVIHFQYQYKSERVAVLM